MVGGAWYRRALALAGALAALLPSLWMWGFTVDDALISLRYAHHLAVGAGYRFDALGPSTDGVTPLPWAPLIAPLAGGDLVVALERAKALGIVAWTLAGAVLGLALATAAAGERRATVHALVALSVVGLAFPVGAWAASGMETGLATALATCAASSFARPRRAASLAGLAAALRPELVVWAGLVAGGAAVAGAAAVARGSAVARAARIVALAVAPFAVCTLARLAIFGRPTPLALLAKPSDAAHGVAYAGAAVLVVLTPILVLAPIALARSTPRALALTLAALAHGLVIVAVGGDWMPYARLMVPVAPALALAFVDVGRVARGWSTALRALAALAVGVFVLRAAPAGREVHGARKDLVAQARPALGGAKTVAALDIGWVGAATDASIVDLAGLTDPAIAALPGGHTSKAVDVAMLLDRGVDTVVLYGEPRIVEQRLLRSPLFGERYRLDATLSFGRSRRQHYDLYRAR